MTHSPPKTEGKTTTETQSAVRIASTPPSTFQGASDRFDYRRVTAAGGLGSVKKDRITLGKGLADAEVLKPATKKIAKSKKEPT